MIRLNLARAPRTLDLGHGVTVTVLPFSSAMMMAARDRLMVQRAAGGEVNTMDLVREIGKLAIMEWAGVSLDGDGEASDAKAPVSDETVAALLNLYPFGEMFQRLYVEPALTLAAEKNASAPSLNGTSAGATPIAQAAPSAARSVLIN